MDGKDFRKALTSVVLDARLMDEHRDLVLFVEANGKQIAEWLGELYFVKMDVGLPEDKYGPCRKIGDGLSALLDKLHLDGCDVRGTTKSEEPLAEWEQELLNPSNS